jgi:hypothetical protein
MIRPDADGPRDHASFRYRGRVHVVLGQFVAWAGANGHHIGRNQASALLRDQFGFWSQPFKYRPADAGAPTSINTYRSEDPFFVEDLPEWPGPRMALPGEPDDDPLESEIPPRGDDTGRLSAAERRLVEQHAEQRVAQCFGEWTIANVAALKLGWDLTVSHPNGAVKHIEVKGSIGQGASVIVTRNEVEQARAHPARAVLAIVSEIQLEGDQATGGHVDLIDPWAPDDDDLVVLHLRYRPPAALRHAVGDGA